MATTSNIGTGGEHLTILDLLERGFEVFGGVSGRESFDLVASKNGRLFRIEVKSYSAGAFLPIFAAHPKFDVLALVSLFERRVEYRADAQFLEAMNLDGAPIPKLDKRRFDEKRAERVMRHIEGAEPDRNFTVGGIAKDMEIARPDVQNALYQLYKAKRVTRRKENRAYFYSLKQP